MLCYVMQKKLKNYIIINNSKLGNTIIVAMMDQQS